MQFLMLSSNKKWLFLTSPTISLKSTILQNFRFLSLLLNGPYNRFSIYNRIQDLFIYSASNMSRVNCNTLGIWTKYSKIQMCSSSLNFPDTDIWLLCSKYQCFFKLYSHVYSSFKSSLRSYLFRAYILNCLKMTVSQNNLYSVLIHSCLAFSKKCTHKGMFPYYLYC